MMTILHINYSDKMGGAGIACTRLCEAMRSSGYESDMLVVDKAGQQKFVHKALEGTSSLFHRLLCRLDTKLRLRLDSAGTFSIMRFGHRLDRMEIVRQADVVFLHWINDNALSLKGVERILRLGKPTFWFMHDMFPITGGCHYSMGCKGYRKDCSDCPMIGKVSSRAVARRQLHKKIRRWNKYENLCFVTPSHWLANCVAESRIAEGHRVYVTPNVLDTDLFRPLPFDSKSLFGLDPNKKTILFGAASLDSIYKGMRHLRDCLMSLDPERYEGFMIGDGCEELVKELPLNIITTGYLSDDISLLLAYNACDTFVISSIAENYPNMVLEAMACGKPCVGYDTGGIPELIIHERTGYITPANTPEELVKGIEYLFADEKRYRSLSENARQQIVENNAYGKVKAIHKEVFG